VLTDGPNFVPHTAPNRAAACASLLKSSTCQRSGTLLEVSALEARLERGA
jgi:hypothetical protein